MPKRIRMSLRLQETDFDFPFEITPVKETLINEIADAMLDAYKGTIDDEGENISQTLDELKRLFRGSYGPLMEEASYLVMEDKKVAAALLTCLYRGEPTITYTFTRKDAQRLGYATGLIAKAEQDLYKNGYHSLFLYVTLENTPAVRLYESLGFIEVPITTVNEINID
ncbi:MAG: GNAT family N-acetyltransferase [Clostridiaceae bacterium]